MIFICIIMITISKTNEVSIIAMLESSPVTKYTHHVALHFFMVERVKKHEFKYKLSSEIIRVGTIPEPTSELNNLELQKSTHHHQ